MNDLCLPRVRTNWGKQRFTCKAASKKVEHLRRGIKINNFLITIQSKTENFFQRFLASHDFLSVAECIFV